MKLLIRLVYAVALLGAFATPAAAQYMYLDSNGDGIHTEADDLNANGVPTTVDVWIITNQNRDGSEAVCNTQDGILQINSYAVNLVAEGGTVTYSNFINQQTAWTVNFGEENDGDGQYKNGYGGPVDAALAPGGPYKLATITITGESGSPSVIINDINTNSPDFTSFGTACSGNDFDNTYKLTGPGGGTDWTDVDGLGSGPGGNAFPTLDIPTEVVGSIGTPITITATAIDDNPADVLTITYTSTAAWLDQFVHTPSVSPATAILSGTPPELSQGVYQVMWSVSDGVNEVVTGTTTVTITEGGGPNDCPVLTPIGNLTANEQELLTFAATATDDDPGQSLTFSLGEGAPTGANLNAETGLFTWTPTEEQGPGEYPIVIRVTDNGSPACTDSETVVVTVNEVNGENQCPVLTPIGDKTVNEGVLLTFTAAVTDPDAGQTHTFSLGEGAPAGATLDPNSGLFNFTPTEEQSPGIYPITIRVFDSGQPACADSETINVTVNEVGENTCPELAVIGDRTVDEGTPLTFNVIATDPDVGQALTYTLDPGFPTGAAIDPNTGVFTFTPTEEQGPGTYSVTFRVTDNADPACSDFETVTITVNEVEVTNECPVLDPIGDRTVNEGTLLTFDANATDADVGQTLAFSLDAGFPAGASINVATGEFNWVPTEEQGPGTYTFTVRVTDNFDPACSDSEMITVTVNEVDGENTCPVLAFIGDRTVDEFSLLTFTATATDPDAGQTLSFSLDAGAPTGAAIHPTTGVFTFTPTEEQGPGTYTVTVRVSDDADPACEDFETITITVNEVDGENQCPVLTTIGDRTVTEGQLLTFTATATDPDGDPLVFSLINLVPAGAAIDPSTGVFTWTPTPDQGPGGYDVTIQVSDDAATPCVDSEIIHVTVLDAGGENQCPVLTAIGDRTVNELSLLSFTATATDADAGQTLTFSLDPGSPTGASIDPNTGVFTFTPTEDQGPGTYTVSVRVTDSADPACSDFETITITVNEVDGENQCPIVEPITSRTVTEGETVSFTVVASDPENETLVFALGPGAPAGAQVHPLTGLFMWTPTDDQAGTYTITFQVRDTCEDPCTVTATVMITVEDSEPVNQCPVLSPIGNFTVEEGLALTFDANATDPDAGQTLTFSLDPDFPPGASINSSTGEFTFTPTHEQIGTHSITVRVTDDADPSCSDFETILVTVEEGENECPVLTTIGDRTVNEGELLTFTATATDPENDEIIFSLDAGAPAGAMIHANTGVFTWTPTSSGTFSITVRATDLCETPCSDTETIQVTVLEVGGVNECPVLAPIGDRTVTEGQLLTFTATATDEDEEEIIFSIDAGGPEGATIHANTGVFTWTPTSNQGPGTYDITIRATDLCDTPCSDPETIQVTVLDAGGGGGDNECPVLNAIGDMTATQGENLAFTATATDADAGPLTFSLVDAPSGATIHSSTGAFLWVPMATGSFTFTVRVTDNEDCSDEETIEVTVNPAGGGGSSTVTAYFVGGNRTTRLWTGKRETCIQLEVAGDDEIDFSTIELVYNGQRLAPRDAERSRDRDRDGNGEATVCFSKQDLRTLFAGLPSGDNMVTFQIAGRFESGESFTANVTHRIAVRGGNGNHESEEDGEDDDAVAGNESQGRVKARAYPNPINPSTVLSFGTSREGSVKVQVYDLAGRLVRTLYEGTMRGGANSVAWDGTGNGGGRVSSGVYYFRVLSPDGQDVVRVTVLK